MARIDRRAFLKLTAAGAASVALPWGFNATCHPIDSLRFFTAEQRATLDAVLALIVPSGTDAGARESGAARYIEVMLAAFDADPPWVFAGGPYSGRAAFPDARTGTPSTLYPADAFEKAVALSRTREIAWRMRLDGSASVRGGGFNDVALGVTRGLRDTYRGGLAALDARARGRFGRAFADLPIERQDGLLAEEDAAFVRLVVEHTMEGMYAAPEYGGNRHLVAWEAIGYAGDSQPLGYAIFDAATGSYNEITATPVSTVNPNEAPGFEDETIAFMSAIVLGAGGRRFF